VGRISKKNILFEFLSLGSPRAVVVDFSVVLFTLAIIPTAFLGQTGGICVWYRFVLPWIFHGHCPENGIFAHCFCPGCGITHSMSRLMHGDFYGAYLCNHLILLVAPIVLILLLWNSYLWIKKGRSRGGASG